MLSHNKNINNLIVNWLIISLLLVFSIIIIGGLTRLTNSGLSITQWELFTGILPPLSQNKWDSYFSLYKEIPQFKLLYPSMTLDEFKVIFYWEYFHRILARIIGIFFLFPLLYFHFVKKINFKKLIPFYLVLLLIILQGIIGWYMVKSGLIDKTTVSHYRLSLHLSIAVTIISIIFWQILNISNNTSKKFFYSIKKEFSYFLIILLIFLQIIFGAFVSGLDAGKIYQTWPLMGNNYFPDDINIKFFLELINFENHSLVQFYHRNIAYIISLYILSISITIFLKKDEFLYKAISFLIIILLVQVLLGILTLITDLNTVIASAHQISSVLLILCALNLYYLRIK